MATFSQLSTLVQTDVDPHTGKSTAQWTVDSLHTILVSSGSLLTISRTV